MEYREYKAERYIQFDSVLLTIKKREAGSRSLEVESDIAYGWCVCTCGCGCGCGCGRERERERERGLCASKVKVGCEFLFCGR